MSKNIIIYKNKYGIKINNSTNFDNEVKNVMAQINIL